MKVYKVYAYGLDSTGFIIAAKDFNEAYQIAIDEDMGNVSYDNVFECPSLQTTETESGVIEQF